MTDTMPAGGEIVRAAQAPDPVALEAYPAPAYANVEAAPLRRPIIPVHLRRENLRGTVSQQAALRWHQARYHGLRSPLYLLAYAWHVVRGARRVTGRVLRWWHWTEGWQLESQAVAAGRAGHHEAMRAHVEGKKTRAARGRIVLACAVLIVVAGVLAVLFAPRWLLGLAAFTVVACLAYAGRPDGRGVIKPAVVAPVYQPPSPEVISRALGSLGIAAIADVIKNGDGIRFVSDVHRDGQGWGCDLDLPHGVTARMILARREQLASGLRRPLSATWPEPVPHEHEGRLRLWVGFSDMSKAKPKPWPLLRAGQADVFGPLPFGSDPRGRQVDAALFEHNWLIGSAPGQGKTSAVRVLACTAALDPLCDLWVHEHAGKGDLEPLSQVCHRYVSGLDDDSIGYAAQSLRMLRAELGRRSAALKRVDKADRPDGKVTRELASRRGLRLRPLVAVFDEVQNVFQHPQHGTQAAEDAAYVIRLGRAYGVIIVLATQRPTSESVPTMVTGIIDSRFCLKVPAQPENDTILGTGSYKSGYNAAAFRAKTDAGLGWLKGEGDPQIVRTFYLDLPATERIAARARVMREQAGVLTGHALGLDDAEPARSFAADVLTVFGDAGRLHTATIARRLAERIPQAYADTTAAAVASQLRGLGVTVKNVREPGTAPGQGCDRTDVEQVTS
jgi:S-DNA-T family DNA segregation ATPase FtsK/SpoIIIE